MELPISIFKKRNLFSSTQRFIFPALILVFQFNFSFSQGPVIAWQNTIGGSDGDILWTLINTADGGSALGGYSSSGISGDKTEVNQGGIDFWVIKLLEDGEIDWQNTIGGSGDEYLYSIDQTTDGGLIVCGYSNSGISGDKTEPSQGTYDYWVVKLDINGTVEWQNTIGGNSDDIPKFIIQTSDGGYFVGGNSNSGISGDKTEAAIGIGSLPDYWVLKLDNAGNIEWQNTIGGVGSDYLNSIEQTSDGGYILGGYSNSGVSGDKTEASAGNYDYWVVKLNNTGIIEWQNTIGGSLIDILFSINQTSNGGYLLAGYSTSGISGDKTEMTLGPTDYWILHLNGIGVIEWQNTIGGNGSDLALSAIETIDGGFAVVGYSDSGISGDKTDAGFGLSDYWGVKLNSIGSVEGQFTLGGSEYDYGQAIAQTADEGYLIGGFSSSGISGNKTEASAGLNDIWVIKLSLPGCLPEICNGLDDDCNGFIDDGITETITIAAGGPTTFCQGNNVLLTATHTGTSLQWKKNGINIPGAISATYTATKSGNYTCETSSICGSATSLTINVLVKKKPAANITPSGPTTFCAGGSVTLLANLGAGLTYQWYLGASEIAGATTTTYTATTAGNYKCKVTRTATGCFKFSNIITVTVPCKVEEELHTGFTLYPNPASSIITLDFFDHNEKTIYLKNELGINLQTISTSEKSINLNVNELAAGIYFIHLEDGIHSVVQKFIKQ